MSTERKAAHTPAPWLVGDATVYALNARGVNRFWALVASSEAPADECRANAHVMGAAPELLDALRMLHPRPGVWRTPTDEEADQIEATIAKATAQEPA